MSPLISPSTFDRRRQLEVIEDQLYIMRAQKDQLEAETRDMSTSDYTQARYCEYKNLLARRKVMAGEISRVAVAYARKKEELEASIKRDYEKRFKDERKHEKEETRKEGLKGKLSKLFGGKK